MTDSLPFPPDRPHTLRVLGVDPGLADVGYGIIDWDDARDQGVPVLDAINHLISCELRRAPPVTYAQTLYRLAFQAWPSAEERAFLARMYRFSRVDHRHHPGLVYLNWLYTADARLAEDTRPNPALVRRYVTSVVDLLSASGQLS